MNEVDDRLAGDPVWELFPYPAPGPAPGSPNARNYRRLLAVACLFVAGWLLDPLLGIVTACLAVAVRDLRTGRQLLRSIPDRAGGTICAHFAYAWGTFKFGSAAFGLTYVVLVVSLIQGQRVPPSAFALSALLSIGGFALSATFTASSFFTSYRSGMRVWVGEGVNQARTLLLAMLVAGFTVGAILPMIVWVCVRAPRASDGREDVIPILLGCSGCMFGGALVILLALDWLSRRVVADRPGKFGPKVPTVGKWNYEPGKPLR